MLDGEVRGRALWVDAAAVDENNLIVFGWFTTPYDKLNLENPQISCDGLRTAPAYAFQRSDVIEYLVANALHGQCRIDMATSFVFIVAGGNRENASIIFDSKQIALTVCSDQFDDIMAVTRYEKELRLGFSSFTGKRVLRFLVKEAERLGKEALKADGDLPGREAYLS